LISSSILFKEKLWERFFQTSLGVSSIVGVYGILQLAGKLTINQGGVRLDATFGNASYLAVYTLFHIFIAAFLMARKGTSSTARYIYGAIILLNSFILYHTATRGAILGLIGGALLCTLLIAFFEKENKKVRKISIGIIASILIIVGLFMLVKDSTFVRDSTVLNRFATISLQERTTQSRFIIWDMAIQGAKEHPVLGWGQENFNLIFNKYYDPRLYKQEPFFDRAHNVFLDWFTAAGFLGLLSYLGIFAAILFLIWRNKVNAFSIIEKSILTGLLSAYFFHNLFVFDNIVSYILFFSVAAYVGARASQISVVIPERTGTYNQTIRYAIISIVIILFIPIMYFVNIKPILANKALLQGIAPQEKGIEENLSQFKKAISYNTFGDQEIREQLIQVSGSIRNLNVTEDLKGRFFDLAYSEMLKQIEGEPDDARHELFLGSFLNAFGMHDEAISHLQRAIELSPKKQAMYLEFGTVYVNKKEYEKALEIMKYAYELDTNYKDARNIYAVTAIYSGDYKLAEDLIMPVFGTMSVDDNRFLNAYAEVGKYDLVIEIWKNRIEKLQSSGEDNAQYHVSLAAAYLEHGQRNMAIKELEKTIELNPEFKDQGQYYIDEIRAGRNP